MSRKIAARVGLALIALCMRPVLAASDPARDAAIRDMIANPAQAGTVLAGATDDLGHLDYALYLHAFAPRDDAGIAKVRTLLDPLEDAAYKALDETQRDTLGKQIPYDGTDKSLTATLQAISSTGTVTTQSDFYAIPCGILQRRPALLKALEPLFGGNRDNFLPRSGCDWGRGEVANFPYVPVRAYIAATEKRADALVPPEQQGTLSFTLGAEAAANLTRLAVNPLSFGAQHEPKDAYPFETKCHPAPQPALRTQYAAARQALLDHLKSVRIPDSHAGHIANVGLYDITPSAGEDGVFSDRC